MQDVTLNNGTVMTDAQFVEQRGRGDTLTNFVATKADLVLLAHKLADELLADEFFLLLTVSRKDINRKDYTCFRLDRVMQFLPELETEIQEILRVGYKKNEEEAYVVKLYFESPNAENKEDARAILKRRGLLEIEIPTASSLDSLLRATSTLYQ